MYKRMSEEYERMKDLAISIIIDYDIRCYPLDIFDLVKRMGFNLIPYSANHDKVGLLLKKSKDGFNYPLSSDWKPTIMYNDKYGTHLTPARITQTIGHEIKHLAEGDIDDSEDDLCDFFSKYLRCPLPYVLYLGINSKFDLISKFEISVEQAGYVIKHLRNRKKKYGNKYFRKELVLLRQLVGDNLDENKLEFVDWYNHNCVYIKNARTIGVVLASHVVWSTLTLVF